MKDKSVTVQRQDSILELILTALNDIVDFELAVILKLTDDHILSVQKAAGRLTSRRLEDYRIDLQARQDIADIIRIGETHLFREEEHHIDTYHGILDLPGDHSCLVAPLRIRGEPLGLLTLDHSTCHMFSPEIVQFIGTISKLISIILDQSDSSQYLLSQQRILTEERNLLLSSQSEAFRDVIGRSTSWEVVLELIRTVAGSDLPVLIQGETGTGKEQVARTIHRLSARRGSQFIALNCSALSTSLAESELFGHERGAFTSAVSLRRGRFELADGGTLFLDEIGDLPREVQPKLLRTLQEGSFERVGGEKTLYSDVRLIAASHVDLKKAAGEGNFREDLYYRIGVFPITLPPLRQRMDDIPLLAEHFIGSLRKENNSPDLRLSGSAVDGLLAYPWPGNVRELQNILRRAALVAGGGIITAEHLALPEPELSMTEYTGASSIPAVTESGEFISMDVAVRRHIIRALETCGGQIYGDRGAARLLGMKPTTLQSRIKKLGIARPGS